MIVDIAHESSETKNLNSFKDINHSASQDQEHKKRGVPVGTKRGDFNKDGTPRKKSGPTPGLKSTNTRQDIEEEIQSQKTYSIK